jgi:hypothetical protein
MDTQMRIVFLVLSILALGTVASSAHTDPLDPLPNYQLLNPALAFAVASEADDPPVVAEEKPEPIVPSATEERRRFITFSPISATYWKVEQFKKIDPSAAPSFKEK